MFGSRSLHKETQNATPALKSAKLGSPAPESARFERFPDSDSSWQRYLGNRYVQALAGPGACGEKQPWAAPADLTASEPGDVNEREADRVAEEVTAAPTHAASREAPQRLRRFPAHSHGQTEPASIHHAPAMPGRPLEPGIRQEMEMRFGCSFSRVRVHSGAAAEQSTREVDADAYAIGRDIVFAAGRFAPGTVEGRRLLAHELTHVVQQTKAHEMPVSGARVAGRTAGPVIARKPRAPAQPFVREMNREEAQAVIMEYIARMPDETSAAMEAIVATLRMPSTVKNWKMRLRVLCAAFSLLNAEGAVTVQKALTQPVGKKQKYLQRRFHRLDSDFRAPLLAILRKRTVAKPAREEKQAAKPPSTTGTRWVELQEGVFAYQVNAGMTISQVAAYLSGHPDLPNVLAQLNSVSRTKRLEEAYPVIVSIDFIDREQAIRDMPEPMRRRVFDMRRARAQQAQYRRFVKVRSGHPYGGVGLFPLTTSALYTAASAVLYLAGLLVGLLKGAWDAVADMFVGAADLIKTVGKVLYRLVTGDLKGIWKMVTGWIGQLKLLWRHRADIAGDFMKKWEAEDPYDRGLFQGKVLGWVMMTVLIVIVTAGAGAVAQIAGKWKFVIDVLKLADRVGDLGTYARAVGKLPGAATTVVRKKLGRTTGGLAEKAGEPSARAVAEKGAARGAKELAEEGLAAKLKLADGHEIKITKDGRMMLCTTCDEFRILYRNLIARDKSLADELDRIAEIADPNTKARALEAWKSKADDAILRMEPPRRVHPHVIPRSELPQRQPSPAPAREPDVDFEEAPTLVRERPPEPRGSVRPARGGTDRDVDIAEGEIEAFGTVKPTKPPRTQEPPLKPAKAPRTQELPRFDFKKLPVPEAYRNADGTPDIRRFGSECIGWGHGPGGIKDQWGAKDLLDLIMQKGPLRGRKSRAYLKGLRQKGVTADMARAWAAAYEHELKRMPGNLTAAARIELMHRIADLL